MEYLINVALAFVPQVVYAVAVWALISAVMKRSQKFKKCNNYKDNARYLFIYLLVSLVLAAANPGITYKHQTFDAAAESRQLELLDQREQQRTDLVIKDRGREDYTVSQEEWDAQSSYKKGLDNE